MEKRNVDITLIFSPDKMAKQKFLYYANYDWKWYSPSMVSTRDLRVIITAAGSDTILWQRDY
jgi:hypothetical protein